MHRRVIDANSCTMEVENDSAKDILSSSEDEDVNERAHASLLRAMDAMDGKKRSVPQRSEIPGSSEAYLPSTNEKVNLNELVGVLHETTQHGTLKKQIDKVRKRQNVLSVPLTKPEQDRVHRSLAYEQLSKDLKIWDPVVQKNRVAEQIKFPLEQPDLRLLTSPEQLIKRIQPKTSMELEVCALLGKSPSVLESDQVLTPAEERALQAMSIEEAKQRRAELQKYRALLSYKEAKAHRQKKIKSKRYHRILQKEKLKITTKALAELQQTDLQAFQEKLQHLDSNRIKERMTLKHRGGSKFAKKQAAYSKFNEQARETVQEMLQKSRDLTKKLTVETDSSDEEEDKSLKEDVEMEGYNPNPWMKTTLEAPENSSSYKKPQPVINKHKVKGVKLRKNLKSNKSVVKRYDAKDVSIDALFDELERTKDIKTVRQIRNKEKRRKKKRKIGELEKDVKEEKKGDVEKDIKKEKNGEEVEKHLSKKRKGGEVEKVLKKKKKGGGVEKHIPVSKQRKGGEVEKHIKGKKGGEVEKQINKKRKGGEVEKHINKKRKGGEVEQTSDDDEESESDLGDSEDEGSISQTVPPAEADNSRVTRASRRSNLSMSTKRKQTFEDFENIEGSDEESLSDEDAARNVISEESTKSQEEGGSREIERVEERASEGGIASVDPKKFFTISSGSAHPLVAVDDDDDDDDANDQSMTIAEAFASDDVVEDFVQEKKKVEDRDKPKDIDFTLPGWGDWGGEGVVQSSKKKFVLKAAPGLPRKDKGLDNVILSEVKDKAVAKHQVRELPFPFTYAKQFESSIRQPLGKTWNPETSYKKLIAPKVITQSGAIIAPIDKESIFKKKQNQEVFEVKFNKSSEKKWTHRKRKR